MWTKFYLNPAACSCQNGKYLVSIMDDSVIMCNEIIESYKEAMHTKAKSNDVKKNYSSRFQWKEKNAKILYFTSAIIN